jgi:hypothetical protein
MRHAPLASEAAWGCIDAVARQCRGGLCAASTSRSPRYGSSDKCRPTSPVRWKIIPHAILLASRDWDAAKFNRAECASSLPGLWSGAQSTLLMRGDKRRTIKKRINFARERLADAGERWTFAPMWRCDPPFGG